MSQSRDLHPIFDRTISRSERERHFGQRARVIWLYGLSGSGKSTLAAALERRLFSDGRATQLLDGDNVRMGLNNNLGFSDADRDENLRRVAEVAKLFLQAGLVTICSFITPKKSQRDLARQIVGADDLIDVYVHASFETCAKRDPKGLYAKALAGDLKKFTGKDSVFEPPASDEGSYLIDTEREGPEESVARLLNWTLPRLQLS